MVHFFLFGILPLAFPCPDARKQRLNPHTIARSFPCKHLLERLLSLLSSVLQVLHLALCLALCVLQALVVKVNAADLCATDAEDEEVDGGKSNVLGADDEAPACPDGTSAHEGEVLGEGERLGGAREVGSASEHHAPFHDGSPIRNKLVSILLLSCVVPNACRVKEPRMRHTHVRRLRGKREARQHFENVVADTTDEEAWRQAYQKCTVLGPMGLFQNFAKPVGSALAAVLTRRRAFARWKKGRKELKMREPGRNDMIAGI